MKKNIWSEKKFLLWKKLKFISHQRPSSINGHLPSKVVFHQRLSSIKGCLSSKIVFYQRSSSIKDCPPSKVVIRQGLSYIEGRLPSKIVFHQWLSSIKCRLPSKVFFHQRSSSIKGHLLLYPRWCLSSKKILKSQFHFILPWLLDCWCQPSWTSAQAEPTMAGIFGSLAFG